MSKEVYLPTFSTKGEALYILPYVLGPEGIKVSVTALVIVVILVILWKIFQPTGLCGNWDRLLVWVPLKGSVRVRSDLCFSSILVVCNERPSCPGFSPTWSLPWRLSHPMLTRSNCHSRALSSTSFCVAWTQDSSEPRVMRKFKFHHSETAVLPQSLTFERH